MQKELIALATTAGDAIREVYERGDYEVTLKTDRSPLTEADHASHAILTDGLEKIFAGIPILSEESESIPYETRRNWDSYFLIDPLDGTREFVKRIPEFAVNIALVTKGHPVVGVIHVPLKRISYYAEKDKGAWVVADKAEKIPNKRSSTESIRVLLSHTDQSSDLEEFLKKIPNRIVHRMGSSLKFCEVAEGNVDFYPRLKPSMEWDTAAGTILVEESEGLVTDLKGKPIEYNRQDMLNPPFLVMGKSFLQKMVDWEKRFL
jgi:3'(2'), 5'-bisphosphate nucleotidase